MKFGIDMDGVLADFTKGFNALVKAELGIDLPYPAPSWDWHKAGGVTSKQTSQLWAYIENSMWWGTLFPLPGALEAIERLNLMTRGGHDVYFITHRPGTLAKFLTEMWLKFHGMDNPTVLIAAPNKGHLAVGLELDVFVDDKPENNRHVLEALANNGIDGTRVYLVDAPYNSWAGDDDYGIRVGSLTEVLDRELALKVKAS